MNRLWNPNSDDRSTAPEIALHIEELVLDGFPVVDRHRIAAMLGETLQRELARAPHFHPWTDRASTLDAIDGGSITVAAGANPDQVGAQLAHVLFQALQGPAAEPAGMSVSQRAESPGSFGAVAAPA